MQGFLAAWVILGILGAGAVFDGGQRARTKDEPVRGFRGTSGFGDT